MARRTLARIAARQAGTFLLELANLSDDQKAVKRFENRFGHIVPARMKTFAALNEHGLPVSRFVDLPIRVWWAELQEPLRAIWEAPDQRTKEWGIFRLIEEATMNDYSVGVLQTLNGRIDALPPPTALEQVLVYLRKQGHRTRRCANPGCPAPYFFAGRRNQKYCSEVCALPSQQEFKRRWWAEHGRKWRRKRAKTLEQA